MNGFKTTMLLAALTALFMGLGYTLGGAGGAIVALLLAAGMNLFTYWNADRIVLRMHDAREVTAESCPKLVGIVHGLAARAGLPMPRVYLIDSPVPNAFATGRDPAHAAVAASMRVPVPGAQAQAASTNGTRKGSGRRRMAISRRRELRR